MNYTNIISLNYKCKASREQTWQLHNLKLRTKNHLNKNRIKKKIIFNF